VNTWPQQASDERQPKQAVGETSEGPARTRAGEGGVWDLAEGVLAPVAFEIGGHVRMFRLAQRRLSRSRGDDGHSTACTAAGSAG